MKKETKVRKILESFMANVLWGARTYYLDEEKLDEYVKKIVDSLDTTSKRGAND